ncbi:hypothetical protein PAHAL_4G298800 [Panicum hallii]|uniref:Fe2OG dioxygenase domain-containing protein n=1 Tax=Panicum hallii TaxID=206008 RepID=A0A2T8JED0_9POAL|nr:hypothetical protein PAHAL_4G298800 [Panicum hallii]PVH48284.1 hypothetical protein PAHAL_4G298800 [Panicum hallii]
MAHTEAGGSLPVPNVQALAQTYNRSDEQIPERYIRVEEAAEEVIIDHGISSAIPIIDVSKLLDPDSSKEECAKLGSACRQWGFFQVINHGVPNEVISNFRNDITEFFKQPLESKKAYSMIPGNLQGYGQHFVVSENQKLDWADLFSLVLRPIDSRDMRFWPSHPPSFRQADKVGLQIRKDGKWIAINALDGAFIVNIGDTLEILSNGRYKSIEHRAMVHPTRERMSAAVFHAVCRDATVGPLPELVKKDGEARYSSMSYMDFVKRFFTAKLGGRGHVESLKSSYSRQHGPDGWMESHSAPKPHA